MLDDTRLQPADVRTVGDVHLEMTIFEGKNRQVRRMCETLGYRVLSLHRTAIGGLMLCDLSPGKWRYMKVEELWLLLGKERRSTKNPKVKN